MKFDTKRLEENKTKTLKVLGQEEWLQPIYKEFNRLNSKGESNLITSEIIFHKLNDELIHAKGWVKYTPFVECNRCLEPVKIHISENFDLYFQEFNTAIEESRGKDTELQKEELDECHMLNGEIDTLQILTDAIFLALPTSSTPTPNQRGDCSQCGKTLTDGIAFSSGDQQETNPFAALKGLKIKS